MTHNQFNGANVGANTVIETGETLSLDATSGKAFKVKGFNAQTGTSYTPVQADVGKVVTLGSASATTLTFAQDSAEAAAIPVGSEIEFIQLGAGLVTNAAGSGATVNRPAFNTLASVGQYGRWKAVKRAANTWLLSGGLAAA